MPKIESVLPEFEPAGLISFIPTMTNTYVSALMAVGDHEMAHEQINKAIALTEDRGIGHAEAESHRLRGELMRLNGTDDGEAEVELRTAIDIGRRQKAKWWELRAAVSLAELLRDRGEIDQARETLAQTYDWFTEGFDTVDLRRAKKLLDSLST